MAFDLASVLKAASDADRTKEYIEYIDLDLIDPDPLNFYSLTDLDGLAESIELLGLQQPIRVRSGENGHVTVVSGHRRRAACMMIRDGGSDMFAAGVPCIRETAKGSAALNELKLIYANSSSRVLSAAEISKQAERVTELLYQLKEEGIEFPGRMREHVAAACSISSAKLARLHAIRENLLDKLLEHFDAGEISESTAYELQKLPPELQQAICLSAEKKKSFYLACDSVKNCVTGLDEFNNPRTCSESGSLCEHVTSRFARTANKECWNDCTEKCCCECSSRATCSSRCRYADGIVDKEKRDEKKAKDASDRRVEARRKHNEKLVRKEAQRLIPLIDAAGLEDADYLEGLNRTVGSVRLMADGEMGDFNATWQDSILPHYYDGMMRARGQLHCSLDFLYCPESENVSKLDTGGNVSNLDTAPTWRDGAPDADGEYLALLDCNGSKLRRLLHYHESTGRWTFGSNSPVEAPVLGWYPIPDIPEEK